MKKGKREIHSQEKYRRIAVPTNDDITIFPGMLGRAKYLNIYEITTDEKFGEKCILIEKRKNPYENTLQHLKTLDVYRVISDCSIIIATKIGKKGIERLKARNMEIRFAKGPISSILKNICKSME